MQVVVTKYDVPHFISPTVTSVSECLTDRRAVFRDGLFVLYPAHENSNNEVKDSDLLLMFVLVMPIN
jgi:hypothetical protein